MEKLEEVLRQYLIGHRLVNLEFFNANDHYYEPFHGKTWVIDGGIQLEFENKSFSLAFHHDKELFDMLPDRIEHLTGDIPLEALGATNNDKLNDLINRKIDSIQVKWNFYQELDEKFELIDEKKYIPLELLLTFENSAELQIACIDFEAFENQITQMVYSSQSHLLISVNSRVEIDSLPEEAES